MKNLTYVRKFTSLPFLALLLLIAAILLEANGCGGSSSPASQTNPGPGKIQHVVVIFQENRTPDNLFQDPVLIGRGADIVSSGTNSSGQAVQLVPVPLATPYDRSHAHKAFLQMYDNGKMDGTDLILVTCNPGVQNCPPPNQGFAYVNPTDVTPYFNLAETYTFGDRMFQTNQGPSFPAHQFIISGTSAPTPPGTPMSNWFAAELPIGPVNADSDTGCTAPPNETVNLIDPSGVEHPAYPCYEHPSLTDQLDSQQISWKYYTPSAGSIWTAPNAIQHMCVPNVPPPNGTVCTGSDWTKNVVLEAGGNQILTDISNSQLAAVSWVIPNSSVSDHSGVNNGGGPSWVASIVNAIGSSQYWSNTAIIITWDDWGGWYDHVPPPSIINSYEYGFRVPLLVVSPYAKSQHVSHQVNDFGSILKFIENTFGLQAVSAGYADALATNDLSDCFDFTQTPLTFQTVPMDATKLVIDKNVPLDPDDD
jgi:phospholipase C